MQKPTVSAIAAVRLLAGRVALTAYITGIAGVIWAAGGAA